MSFFADPHAVKPADPNVTPAERKRLGAKCQQVLDRLREGPASNVDLLAITYSFSQRIWDLRRAGYVIRTDEDDRAGISTFTLIREP